MGILGRRHFCTIGGTALTFLSLGLSAQNNSLTEEFVYHNNTDMWVIGQLQSIKCISSSAASGYGCGTDGREVMQNSFDSLSRVSVRSENGKLLSTISYHANGTVATITDGSNNVSVFNNWKRGSPQEVIYADGTRQTSEIDNNGWVKWVRNEAGAKTCLRYDMMGRVDEVTYTSEGDEPAVCDESAWNRTSIEFRPLVSSDWRPPGVEPGQWRQYTSQGNYRKVVYLDAMWRPILTHEYDASDSSGTMRAVSMSYDSSGRVVFQSYASGDLVPPPTGTWTFYDAMGRVKEVRQDSEQGQLITKTEYLGQKVRVTTPDNEVLMTTFQALDEPTYSTAIRVEEPLGRTTLVTREVYGKPLEIERKN